LDYDLTDIPAGYDRGRDHGPEMLALWMNSIAAHIEGETISRILDLGCGTGRFSQALADRFNAEVIGIDPSHKMLARAREKGADGRVHYQHGHAESLPLVSEFIDMIFMSMSFHHFSDQARAAQECRRVLRAGGSVFVRTGTREQIASYPYVPFFPSSRKLIEEVLPDRPQLRDIFESAGFRTVNAQIITQTIAQSWWTYAEKLAAGADSVLARLDPQEFERGLIELRAYGATRTEQDVVEPIDLFVFR
jgi:ubiquinone/menaquinone biosynthesis C-methylase UbiE